jgi:hypothetical protein
VVVVEVEVEVEVEVVVEVPVKEGVAVEKPSEILVKFLIIKVLVITVNLQAINSFCSAIFIFIS